MVLPLNLEKSPCFPGQMPMHLHRAGSRQCWTIRTRSPLQIGGSTQDGEVLDVERYYIGSKELQLDQTNFSTVEKGQKSVEYIENAIEAVSKVRASFGAAYMHLDHTHNNLSVTSENMQAAESQIRDTNMAEEITKYTSSNIVLQSSNRMLTNANNLPQTILELLK